MAESGDALAAKSHFEQALGELAVVGGFAMHVSQLLTGEPTTQAGELASMIHAKMCANARSIGQLAVSSMFDHSAILATSRMLMDAMTMYFYLHQSVEQPEWQFRKLVLDLHDTTARIKLLRAWQPKSKQADLRQSRDRLIAAISSHALFCDRTSEQKGRLLSGEEMFVGGMRAAAIRAGWREETFIAIYNYFSAHTHAAPMSYMRMRHHATDFLLPSEAQLGSAAMATVVARACLLRVTISYLYTSPAAVEKMQPELLASWRIEDADGALFSSGKK